MESKPKCLQKLHSRKPEMSITTYIKDLSTDKYSNTHCIMHTELTSFFSKFPYISCLFGLTGDFWMLVNSFLPSPLSLPMSFLQKKQIPKNKIRTDSILSALHCQSEANWALIFTTLRYCAMNRLF